MKPLIALLLLSLMIIGCQSTPSYQLIETEISSEEQLARITTLRNYITPPNGTSKTDVDAVFGEPAMYNGRTRGGYTYYYQLIPSEEHPLAGTRLDVIYTDSMIVKANISHAYVVQGRLRVGYDATMPAPIFTEPSYQYPLSDLIHIKNKYEKELKNAPWNEGDPNQGMDPTSADAQSVVPEG